VFDEHFTAMLNHLQSAWADGKGDELDIAINIMRDEMADPACELMQKLLPSGGGNFGPDFRLISK
jgi:hypothetical protein